MGRRISQDSKIPRLQDSKKAAKIILALDVGERHTGVAYARLIEGVPLPLETVSHGTKEELVDKVAGIVAARNVSTVVLGYPLLPSGKVGKQARFVEEIAELLRSSLPEVEVILLDERYTTPRDGVGDPHATAALGILQVYLDREALPAREASPLPPHTPHLEEKPLP